jgi:glycosyltransferase involved in cell wall biosynthesis
MTRAGARVAAALSRIGRPIVALSDRTVDRWQNPHPSAIVAINRRPVRAPWGGGNQWLEQMIRQLRAHGCSVRFALDADVECVVIADPRAHAGVTFDVASIAAFRARHPRVPCIHRVNDNDKHRGSDFRDAVQAAANRIADHTVFISEWLREYEADRWFDRSRPHSVILNGADPSLFHPRGGADWTPPEPFRLVTHHWSNDWNKGFDVYAELDRLIAEGVLPGVELWVIGRWPDRVRWQSARTFPPMHGGALADLLRQCHGYITASRWESGGMHFIEGLQCGLPLLYHPDGGGVVELGRRFGVAIGGDVAAGVRALRDRYRALRAPVLADPPSGDRMCQEYGALIHHLIDAAQAA